MKSLHPVAGLLSGAVLLLLPKCPACVAGYLAVSTGFGVSLSVASGLRTGLLLLASAVLALAAIRGACYLAKRFSGSKNGRRFSPNE